ncbi:cysteine synthase A [Thermotomaculum hydrothermale]|uniref:cysteine synthase n=1 Tax=Thermotomaculum hydrothermale TaxID=981385 RepID=A0A7R6PV74_9BACT|nr:cysteine synthase A [Thermotomaculum hydrothermale]BBB33312.1 cysteine synthase A [Thermotomaculum hydrothermale]
MAKIYNSMLELVGNTPIVRVSNIDTNENEIFLKLEYFNPLSSVKDRAALGMIEDAIERGVIKENTVIVEATSGNTGIGLAFICALKNIPIVIFMPESASVERRKIMKGLGAKVVLTDKVKGMKGAIEEAQKLVNENSDYIMLNQFENPANPDIHSKTTAREIIETLNNLDYFVAGIGTGGTFTGAGRVLKKHYNNLTLVAVEPEKSAVISGKNPSPHKIQGIGAGFIPKNLDTSLIDKVITVTEEEAFKNASLLLKREGVFCGISGGANFSAALELSKQVRGKKILCIIPDTGERYLSVKDFLQD